MKKMAGVFFIFLLVIGFSNLAFSGVMNVDIGGVVFYDHC